MHSPFRAYYQGDSGIIVSDQNPPAPLHAPYTAEGNASIKLIPFDIYSSPADGGEYMEFELLNRDVRRIFEYQQLNPKFHNVNAILCSSPVSYCESYLLLNKSVIWYVGSQRWVEC